MYPGKEANGGILALGVGSDRL